MTITEQNKNYYELILNHIDKEYERVFKDEGDLFPFPFIDPGAAYSYNLWDWDTFWSVYALENI